MSTHHSGLGQAWATSIETINPRISKVESCTFGVHENGYAPVSSLVKTISETAF